MSTVSYSQQVLSPTIHTYLAKKLSEVFHKYLPGKKKRIYFKRGGVTGNLNVTPRLFSEASVYAKNALNNLEKVTKDNMKNILSETRQQFRLNSLFDPSQSQTKKRKVRLQKGNVLF